MINDAVMSSKSVVKAFSDVGTWAKVHLILRLSAHGKSEVVIQMAAACRLLVMRTQESCSDSARGEMGLVGHPPGR